MRAYSFFPVTVSIALVLAMAGCQAAAPADRAEAAGSITPPATGVTHEVYEDVPPATVPPGTLMPGQVTAALEGPARWDGFGDVQLGMSSEQVALAWPGELDREGADDDGCYYLIPIGVNDLADVAMMFEDGAFVRYGVEAGDIVAPGGGMRGMDIAQIEVLYPGRVEQSGHEYVIGGHYLRIQEEGGEHVLLFEADETGTVTGWRVGLQPQVDYSEGCS